MGAFRSLDSTLWTRGGCCNHHPTPDRALVVELQTPPSGDPERSTRTSMPQVALSSPSPLAVDLCLRYTSSRKGAGSIGALKQLLAGRAQPSLVTCDGLILEKAGQKLFAQA